jgi:hypothetical protein
VVIRASTALGRFIGPRLCAWPGVYPQVIHSVKYRLVENFFSSCGWKKMVQWTTSTYGFGVTKTRRSPHDPGNIPEAPQLLYFRATF